MISKARVCSLTFEDLAISKQKIVSITPNTSLQDALATMASNNVLTLPITARAFPNRFAYILSTFDILIYLVSKFHSQTPDLTKTTVEAAMTMDQEQESYRVFERDIRDTLESTLIAFAKGAHRVLVTDALGSRPSIVLTQSDILKYVQAHPDSLTGLARPLSSITLAQAGLISHKVVSLRDDETALQGYNRMVERRCLALPVLDKAGLVVATLSASDLRGLSKDSVAFVHLPVLEFLAKMSKKTEAELASLTPNDTMQDALNLLVERDVHRVWILDDGLRPVGVVSQSDVIAAIVGVNAS